MAEPRSGERLHEALTAALLSAERRWHRHRLRRLGWEAALDATPGPWAVDGEPPRDGNRLEILIDGAVAFPRIVEAIRGATSHVHLGLWSLTAGFGLVRAGEHLTVRDVLAEAAERVDVRLLLWSGARVPMVHPSHREAAAAIRQLRAGTRIRAVLDDTKRRTSVYHEKLVIVDGHEAYVGGLDPTTIEGDRYDDPSHPPRGPSGWHDAHARLTGPAVADVSRHFARRWQAATDETLPAAPSPPPAGASRVQMVRTAPANLLPTVPRGDFTALESHLAALRSAERLIYIETQFLWSIEVCDVLADKLRNPPHDEFRLVAVLPVHPRSGYDDTRGQLRSLQRADRDGHRLIACSLRTRGPGMRRPVYVHSKLTIVDDRWLSIGSLNLSDHGMLNDVDVQLVTDDGALARATRERLWAEHLDLPEEAIRSTSPTRIVDERWAPVSADQLEREERGLEPTARIVRMRAASRWASRLTGATQRALLDG